MKLVVSRKNLTSAGQADPLHAVNSGFGNTFKAMKDNEVDAYVESQAHRGFVCYVFNHSSTVHSQTTIVQSQAA